jgi:hypothetical protein
MDGAALDTSPSESSTRNVHLGGSPCSHAKHLSVLEDTGEYREDLEQGMCPLTKLCSRDFLAPRLKEHGHFRSQFAESYKSQPVNSDRVNKNPDFPSACWLLSEQHGSRI